MVKNDLSDAVMAAIGSRPHYLRHLKIAARYVGRQDAEDVVQGAYERALRNKDQFRGGSTAETWLCRIVINDALNEGRKRERFSRFEGRYQHMTPSSAVSAEDSYAAREMLQDVQKRFAEERPLLRRTLAIIIKYETGEPFERLAAQERVGMPTLRSRFHYARQTVRQAYKKAA